MTRNLKTLGLALVVALALSAMAASAASATATTAAKFTFAVGHNETARVDGEQIAANNNTFRVAGLPPITCQTVSFSGSAVTQGPESTEVRVTPTFDTCHLMLFNTKLVTITPNNCHFILHAKTTVPQNQFVVTTDIDCTGGLPIEIHIYNNTTHNETLCTYDIGDHEHLQGVTPTNEAGPPDDILAHINLTGIVTKRTSGSLAWCGPENSTSTYTGTGTVRATNEKQTFVNGTIST